MYVLAYHLVRHICRISAQLEYTQRFIGIILRSHAHIKALKSSLLGMHRRHFYFCIQSENEALKCYL